MTNDDNSLLCNDNYYTSYPSIVVSHLKNKVEKKMRQTSQKFVVVLTVLLMVAFTSQSFSQIKEHITAEEYAKYVGNLQSGINSDNVGLKISAIQFTGLYQVTENTSLLVSKYKEEKDQNIKHLIAISLFLIGDSEALMKIGLDEKSILNNFSLSMLAEMYKIKAGSKIRNIAALDQ